MTISKTLKFWDAQSGRLLTTFEAEDNIEAFDISNDGSYLAYAVGPKLGIISLDDKEQLRLEKVHNSTINDVEFSPRDRWIATASGRTPDHEKGFLDYS